VADAGIDTLVQVPEFALLSKRHLRRVLKAMHEYQYPAGESIVREGAHGQTLFVVLEGKARVSRRGRTVGRVGPGDFFGEIAVLDRGPRTASVVAETPVRCWALHREELRDLIKAEPTLGWALLESLASRLRSSHGD
jgi:CRP/FNR family transcriptional regulator, cyclic AMP receptor protein